MIEMTFKKFPKCEECEVFLNIEIRSNIARGVVCEGMRAVGKCPKDVWRRDAVEKLTKDIVEYTKDRKRCLENDPKEEYIACQVEGKIIVAKEFLEALK